MNSFCSFAHLVPIVVLSVAALAAADDGYVGVFADAAGTQPCAAIEPGHIATLYVVGILEGQAAAGIAGAEFRIEVANPAGWLFSYSAPTGSTPIGNALDVTPDSNDNSGLVMAFPSCQGSGQGHVSLGTIMVFNLSGSPTTLTVRRHSIPSNPGYPCPLFVLCDAPTNTKSCMSIGAADNCSLSKSSNRIRSEDPAIFVTGLNTLPDSGGLGVAASESRMADLLKTTPFLCANPDIQDVTGLAGDGKPALTASIIDTTWIADWNFEGSEGCSESGRANGPGGQPLGPATPWTTKDNLVRNDAVNYYGAASYWRVGQAATGGPITGQAAILQVQGCWASPGYGNEWDQAIRLRYRGVNATVTFGLRFDADSDDEVTVEADSAGASNASVVYTSAVYAARRPESYRDRRLTLNTPTEMQVGPIQLPYFGNSNIDHFVLIRFHSDYTFSTEDGSYPAPPPAPANPAVGVVVDNVVVTGGLPYTESFEGASLNTNVELMNSDRSLPYAKGGNARLWSHVTDNDKCVENNSCAWLFTKASELAVAPQLSFGPGASAVPGWVDDIAVSPWMPLSPGGARVILKFNEFPGNRYAAARIQRAVGIRGRRTGVNAETCISQWQGDASSYPGSGTWDFLDSFNWTTQVRDLTPWVDQKWSEFQIRFRVADWQGLFSVSPPALAQGGPGPYIDRVRVGRSGSGPVI